MKPNTRKIIKQGWNREMTNSEMWEFLDRVLEKRLHCRLSYTEKMMMSWLILFTYLKMPVTIDLFEDFPLSRSSIPVYLSNLKKHKLCDSNGRGSWFATI